MKSSFSNEEWFAVVSIPFALDTMLTNGANVEQRLIFQSDINSWNDFSCPLYQEICKYLAVEKNWEEYAGKMAKKVTSTSFSSYLESFVPVAKKAINKTMKPKQQAVFFGHILYYAFRHGMVAGTGVPFGSAEIQGFLDSYLAGFEAPKESSAELERLLKEKFGN